MVPFPRVLFCRISMIGTIWGWHLPLLGPGPKDSVFLGSLLCLLPLHSPHIHLNWPASLPTVVLQVRPSPVAFPPCYLPRTYFTWIVGKAPPGKSKAFRGAQVCRSLLWILATDRRVSGSNRWIAECQDPPLTTFEEHQVTVRLVFEECWSTVPSDHSTNVYWIAVSLGVGKVKVQGS